MTRDQQTRLASFVYGDAKAGDGKPDGDSGADGDAYYHDAPVLSVKFGLNWFQVSENQTSDLGPDPTLPSPWAWVILASSC